MRTSKFYAFELIKMNSTICAAMAYLQEQRLTGAHRRAEYRCNFFSHGDQNKNAELSMLTGIFLPLNKV